MLLMAAMKSTSETNWFDRNELQTIRKLQRERKLTDKQLETLISYCNALANVMDNPSVNGFDMLIAASRRDRYINKLLDECPKKTI